MVVALWIRFIVSQGQNSLFGFLDGIKVHNVGVSDHIVGHPVLITLSIPIFFSSFSV